MIIKTLNVDLEARAELQEVQLEVLVTPEELQKLLILLRAQFGVEYSEAFTQRLSLPAATQ